ncbi:MAG TPA: hypothetical protein VF221_18315 [Chloroflexota bacterium]
MSGHKIGLSGKGWGGHVVLTVEVGGAVGGVVLQTRTGGDFRVGADPVNLCGGANAEARDRRGDDVTVHLRGPLCPNTVTPPPRVVILQGTADKSALHVIHNPQTPQRVSLSLGDRIELTAAGQNAPPFTAQADQSHLALVRQGVQMPPGCTTQACGAAGTYIWVWAAVHRGNTAIDISPECRLSTPPCARPDFAIDVTIR